MGGIRHAIKRRLRGYKLFAFAIEARWELLSLWDAHTRFYPCVPLSTDRPARGTVLLSYVLEGFLKPNEPLPLHHTNYWEAQQIARTFLELGYDVDAIDHRNERFAPEKHYDIVIDSRHNLQRLAPLLPPSCIKIFHIDMPNKAFENVAEGQRLLDVQQRRGVTLRSRRYERTNLGIETADYATMIGNDFTESTFRYANKRIFRLPIPAACTFPWPDGKNWERARRRFLFFSSGGMIRKGLDLVLEAFARMPEYHLTVCGSVPPEPFTAPQPGLQRRARMDGNLYANPSSVALEEDFLREYERELYRTPNIHTVGWVDIGSQQFLDITQSCVAVVHASCAEGTVGSVITCMHAGLIPIVSYESGVDVHDFGTLLKSASIADIEDAVHTVATLPFSHLEQQSRKAWEFARAHHTRENYAYVYRQAIETILSSPHPAPKVRREAA